MKKAFRIIAANFLVFGALIVGLEVVSQLTYAIKNGRFLFSANLASKRVFEIHPYLVGRPKSNIKVTQNNKTITIMGDHTRWTGVEPSDQALIRVAVLGGSTTFGTGVTDEDSWPALLQATLGKQYAVINYGVPGYSTAENIIQMALTVAEQRPDIAVFYEGWNDIRNYHEK